METLTLDVPLAISNKSVNSAIFSFNKTIFSFFFFSFEEMFNGEENKHIF